MKTRPCLLARIFKLGFLADFLSRTVLAGFFTGVGFQIGIAMLSPLSAPAARTAVCGADRNIGADLFYANDNRFADEVRTLIENAPSTVRWFVVDASAMTDIDYSAALSLPDLCDDLKRREINLVFGRVNAYLREDMDRHCITSAIGEESIFPTLHESLAAVRRESRETTDQTVS